MSDHGRSRGADRTQASIWSVVIIFASGVGGLLGVALIGGGSILLVLIVSLLIAVACIAGLNRNPREPGTAGSPVSRDDHRRMWLSSRSSDSGPVFPGGSSGSPGAHHERGEDWTDGFLERFGDPDTGRSEPEDGRHQADKPHGPDGVVQLRTLPGERADTDRPWWDPPAVSPAASTAAAAGPDPEAPVASYLEAAVIAQCPRCGSFSISVDERGKVWAFGCQECAGRWTWCPGDPWPAVEIQPALRHRSSRPPPENTVIRDK